MGLSSHPPSNGAIRISRPPPPLGIVLPTRDPLDRVMGLGKAATTGIFIGILFTILAHGTAAARAAVIPIDLIRWNSFVAGRIKERLWSTYDVDIIKAPPPKVEEQKPEPEEPKPQPVVKQAPTPKEETPPPPPAAAQAGKILAAEPDPNEPVDMTNTFVQGSGSSFAGGYTAPAGTSTAPVRDQNAKPGGTPGGTGTGEPAPPAVDRSRPAGRIGSDSWDCPFPPEADSEQIDEAKVMIEVSVRPDGKPDRVTIVKDPGHGFGREARSCAMRKSYTPALDRDGNPIAGVVKAFNVHFTR